ncbi:unnamed protein product [Clonostachys solani]|uniref:Multidrug resistance protein 1 n=1 Tax=Clonostachys solani TaxID=160281 RepID=A0A9P0EKN4_9HYPO|nr:unnamed protein product [Clonostachys solani]
MASAEEVALGDERKRAILDRQLHGLATEDKDVNIFQYFTTLDKVILFVSSVCAVLAGALNPLVPVIYGLLVGAFNGFEIGTVSADELRSKISTFSLYYVYLSIALFVFTYVATVGYYFSGERFARALRNAYLSAVMRQNLAFFDLLGPGEITNRIMSDMGTIQEAVTSKLAVLLTAIATFCAAYVVAFIMYWKTALILSPFFVAMLASGSIGGAYAVKHFKLAREQYSQASGIAEEALGAIKHITAFGIQKVISKRYLSVLSSADKQNSTAENIVAGMIAWMNTMPNLLYALSFWAGSIYLVKQEVSVAGVTATTLAITIGSFAITRIAPSAQALTSGVAVTGQVLKAISRKSPEDPMLDTGEVPAEVVGEIRLENVELVYPSRDDVTVLNGVTLTCPAMKRTAIVGPSGSGKSSILGLLERFYQPTDGNVSLDGHDVQSLNLRWLRRQISLVDQNPVLFNGSIFENITFGISDVLGQLSKDEIEKKVFEAAKKANAHDFVTGLPEGYQTQVGEKGFQLSGGQRQRIAIARALVKDPKILLLDEATSALDSKSESIVQAALNVASERRTTIIVAHRLSTVRNADNIIVLADGKVVEEGSHGDLLAKNGVYAGLVQKQQISDTKRAEIEAEPRYSIEDIKQKASSVTIDDPESKETQSDHGQSLTTPATSTKEAGAPSAKSTALFMTRMSKTDWKVLTFGLVCAIFAGLTIPAQSVFFAKLLTVIGLPSPRYSELRGETNLWSGVFVALAGGTFILFMGLEISLAYATKRLSHRVRELCFGSMISQDMAYFDEQRNSPSALSSILSKSTDDLSGMGGPVLGGLLTFISTILGGIVVSLAIGWKLALVCTATIPVVVACGWLRLQVLTTFDSRIRQSGVDSAAYAGELVRSMRTVASLGLEQHALARYDGFLAERAAKSLRPILSASALYAASQSVVYLCAALGFWYGGILIADREYTAFQVYICFVCLISGSQIAGSIFTFAPDASKAMHASHELQGIIGLKSRDKSHAEASPEPTEKKPSLNDSKPCHIVFDKIGFSYPSRPNKRVLENFSITIEPGQTLALVGQSGSGKSTCISLLERFYEPDQGRIIVDGHNIESLDIDEYRRNIALVSQETIIFSGTIRENITIGLAWEEVSDDAVLEACRQANIAEFIESLPDGLSTLVGMGGSMLSGGQKQRISIARAFLRSPKILLLDEATSALDTESEAVVQTAMNAIMKGRTTVMVAHRLSTVRNAHTICVLQDGMVIEMGNHEQLMAKHGKYFEMVGMQNLH